MAAEKFAEQLRTLRTGVGNPSFRKMAGRSGRISHTTLHEAAAGTRFPSWETTREFVRACEADEAQWRCRWEDAQRSGTVHAAPDDSPTPVDTDSPTRAGISDAATTRVVAAETSRAVNSAAAGGPVVSGVATSADLVPAGPRALRVAEHLPAVQDDVAGARRHPLPWLAAAATVVVVVALVAALGFAVRGRSSPGGSGAVAASQSPSPPAFSDALIPGDSSKFVADITIPDGTRVKVNARFEKVWALKNVGSVDWHNRFLARTNPTADDDDCRTPDRVAIGDTPPGEQVMISVVVTAPNRPGKCWVSWKMVDEHGQEYFPTRRPVYFMVTVIA
ncbi:NBR1-Ig-like domain-containing protein [Micromonospora halotolerans]|uniref:NBR1-Ig-like domain-containing protein n=1 Tax=Micromonospora halotolerans TaxID=709879 RepID=A0ABY9ZY50_9ACTN|nr:NBR1-Ig-like domain-containing protein [Micromonospora halotolerans]WNM39306.1 NBR1-Ig-like domain-containing protein [Micromonospora halotolerans]